MEVSSRQRRYLFERCSARSTMLGPFDDARHGRQNWIVAVRLRGIQRVTENQSCSVFPGGWFVEPL
jgi:hypothetical protein